ncbi:MAG: hypothetical protein IJ809_05240 [Clostridia bacterium]|nr:hypothetical protein [Clostridia bacterium]
MQVSIKGKSIFTDDGFIPGIYDTKMSRRVISKILSSSYYEELAVIGSRSEFDFSSRVMLNFLSYSRAYANLLSIDSICARENQRGDILLPDIDCLVWDKGDAIKVLAYGNKKMFVVFESVENTKRVLLAVKYSWLEHEENLLILLSNISRILGKKINIQVYYLEGIKKYNDAYNIFSNFCFKTLDKNMEARISISKNEGIDRFEFYRPVEEKNHVIVIN